MSKVLIGLTGSIACFKVAGLISSLVQEGHEVRTIATASALKFIGKASLEGLSGNPVMTETFEPGGSMEHIQAGRWADLFLIAPCTANTMAKLKVGLADDLLSTTALAYEKNKPVFIAPAMNKEMWSHITTQESYVALKDRGYQFIDPEDGILACAEVGSGRMAEPDTILNQILPKPSQKILITGGGTREPIDGVRFIGNTSTGKTSQSLAHELRSLGFQVKLLMAQNDFTDFKSLNTKLQAELGSEAYDAVIHAAAVSDYSVNSISSQSYNGPPNPQIKFATNDSIEIKLSSNPKILSKLRSWSKNSKIQVIGFKLTQTMDEAERVTAIQKLFENNSVDYVVHNDLNEIKNGAHPFRVLKNDQLIQKAQGSKELSRVLSEIIGGAR